MAANSELAMAVHALCWLELSGRRGEPELSSERIAASLASHPVAVRRSLARLHGAGLVVASRGRGSGWRLARPAARVTLLDVYDALGHQQPFALHPHEPNLECPVGYGIRPALGGVFADLDAVMSRQLAAWTIADLLDNLLQDYPLPPAGRAITRRDA